MKKIFTLVLALSILFVLTSAQASDEPDDITYPIKFFVYSDSAAVYNRATSTSDYMYQLSSGTMVMVNGIQRSGAGNVWLRMQDGCFIRSDDLFIDFETLLYDNCILVNNDLINFFNLVREGQAADYKNWLNPRNTYRVRFSYGDSIITAEQLGNMHYGALGTAIGLSDKTLLYAGGAVNLLGLLEDDLLGKNGTVLTFVCFPGSILSLNPICSLYTLQQSNIQIDYLIEHCSKYYCDTKEDVPFVQQGINYCNSSLTCRK